MKKRAISSMSFIRQFEPESCMYLFISLDEKEF